MDEVLINGMCEVWWLLMLPLGVLRMMESCKLPQTVSLQQISTECEDDLLEIRNHVFLSGKVGLSTTLQESKPRHD